MAATARLLGGGFLLVLLFLAAQSPQMPHWLAVLAFALFALAAWRPAVGWLTGIALAPFGALLAGVPVRASETLIYACAAAWLLRLFEPLDPGGRVPRRIVAPALAFAAAIVASWVVVVSARTEAGGAWALITTLLRTIPLDYLVTAGRDPQTAAAFQLLLAMLVVLAIPALAGTSAKLPVRMAGILAAAGLVAAAATLVGIPVRYALTNYDPAELTRYLEGARFSAAFNDVNAAGSYYVLTGLIALAMAHRSRGTTQAARAAWIAGLVLLVPAFWLSGSRAAMASMAAAGVLAWCVWRGAGRPGTAARAPVRTIAVAALAIVLAVAGSAVWLAARGTDGRRGTAAWSMSMRQQFLVTSARMTASAPVFGVGVGRYYERSGDFMPEQIRTLYGRENAHNYFAQTIAELGVTGAAMFLWLLAAVLLHVWSGARAATTYDLPLAVLVACLAYLGTSVTGHPFLVIEASLPFWAAMGTGVALVARPAQAEGDGASGMLAAGAIIVFAATLPLRLL